MTYRTSGKRPKFSASELNRLTEAADRQFIRTKIMDNSLPAVSESSVVLAKNSSGADRERFDCMSISGILWDFEPDGTTDLIFDLATADPDEAPAILLEPIANGAFGFVMIDGPAAAKVEASADAGYRFAVPKASTHSLEPAEEGSIKLLAAPSTSAVKYLPCILNVGGVPASNAIIDIRISGLNYQYTKDGVNWTTWATAAEDCPPPS